MTKIGVNDICLCGSKKKYKKCCMIKEQEIKYEENLKYSEGQQNHSDKMKFCINFYTELFKQYKIINITDDISPDNYNTYLIKNLNSKIIMLAEKTYLNRELFLEKSDSDRNDLIIMHKGGYKILPALDILKYEDDIKKFIDRYLVN
jgi:hypothetical protein